MQSLKKSTSDANTEKDGALVNTTSTTTSKENEPEKPKYDWGSGVGYSIQSSRHEQDSAKDLNNLNEDDAAEMDTEPEVNIVSSSNHLFISSMLTMIF